MDKKADEIKKSNDHCALLQDTTTTKTHHIYLYNEIAEPVHYVEMFNVLKTSEKGDEVFIYLNTPGGYLHTTTQIIAAMKECKSSITCVMDGTVCSCGSLIFLSGQKQRVNYGSVLMCHWYSTSEYGKGQEVKASIDFMDAHLKNLFSDIYRSFLTDKELSRLFAGEDFWFGAEDVKKRLLSRSAKVNKSSNEKQKA